MIFFIMSKQKATIVSGYFNPIHKGHLEYFNNAKAIADKLFVIVNNEYQQALKVSKEFLGVLCQIWNLQHVHT